MIQHDSLPTLTVHTDWDEPLVSNLEDISIFFCEKGYWEKVEEVALDIFQMVNQEGIESDKPLKNAYNLWLAAKQVYMFDPEDEEGNEAMTKAESDLAHVLLAYHDDPEIYLIVHALDEDHYDEAWYLCFREDVDDLNIKGAKTDRPLSA